MRHVTQRHANACGVAAFAMLTGISYNRSLHFIHPDRKPGSIVKPSTLEMERGAFNRAGIPIIVRWKPIKLKDLRKDAYISITLPVKYGTGCWCGRGHHAVVWDYDKQKLIDPSKPSYNFTNEYIEDNMEYYLCKR